VPRGSTPRRFTLTILISERLDSVDEGNDRLLDDHSQVVERHAPAIGADRVHETPPGRTPTANANPDRERET